MHAPVDVLRARLEKLEADRHLNYEKFIEAGKALGQALSAWNKVPMGALTDADQALRTALNQRWAGRV